MQEDNQRLMPELKNVLAWLQEQLDQEGLKGVPRESLSDYMRGYQDALLLTKEDMEECFNWSRRGGISGYVNSLDYDQLCRLIEVAQRLKASKDEEQKLVLHQIIADDDSKNFREDQLQEALTYYHQLQLRRVAENPGNLRPLQEVELRHVRVRASEYEEYFD